MKILVVEDDPLILSSLREMVEAWGHACDEASDGRVAWELLQACPYDLVLLDLNLPGIDGLTLCQRLRQAGGHQPLQLMLTASLRWGALELERFAGGRKPQDPCEEPAGQARRRRGPDRSGGDGLRRGLPPPSRPCSLTWTTPAAP